MIKPLTIASRTFPNNLVLGPLAGISTTPYRLLSWKYSKPAFAYSEMISANALARNHQQTHRRYLDKSDDEGPLCFQLVGGFTKELAEATKIITNFGSDLIDFNCGCSVPKIYKNGSGSSLLSDPKKLYQLLSTIRKNTSLPFLVKIRVAVDDNSNAEIAEVINDAGVDAAVVHGRNWKERFNVPCRYDAIQFFVENLKIPVIGNGDVNDLESLQKMFKTGCAGVMVARAAVGQPWLIGKLTAEMEQRSFTTPTIQEIGKIFIEHVEGLQKLLGSERNAVVQARKFTKAYAKSIRFRKELCTLVNQCKKIEEFKQLCHKYFTN